MHPNAYNLSESEMAKFGIEIEKSAGDRIAINNYDDLKTKEFTCIKIRGEAFL